uniref:Uncharacterized protein n=1 Tax=Acrobeloides nanus TaxID=290746 RepID=A0A914CMG0_9BILA
MDCSFLGYRSAQACMKLIDYSTGVAVRFCNAYACSSLIQGRLANTPCINDTYSKFQQYGYTYAQLQGINYSPNYASYLSLCCCSGDGCNSGETIKIIEKDNNSAIQNLTDEIGYRIKALNSDINLFNKDFQALYASIENSAKEYLDNIKKIGVELEKSQLIVKSNNTYKKYTLNEIEQNTQIDLGNYTSEIGGWVEEQINSHTTEDGTSRDKAQICKSLQEKFQIKYGGRWACFFSQFYSFQHDGFLMSVSFNDDMDKMIIFRE